MAIDPLDIEKTIESESGKSGGYRLSPGDTLGQYRILRPPGAGSPGAGIRRSRSGDHYHEKWEYVRLNPVRKELVRLQGNCFMLLTQGGRTGIISIA